jgi:hypothetical protein
LMGTEKISISTKEVFEDISVHFWLNVTWIWWEAAWLDISSYMLAKFMYWNGASDYYWTNHWISEKVKDSDFYKDEINTAKNSIIKGWTYSRNITWDIWESLFDDFGTSFWTVNWNLKADFNENWDLQTNFYIKDTYTFNDHYWDGSVIENPFNVLAKYYQDRWYGTSFEWELNIVETYNY